MTPVSSCFTVAARRFANDDGASCLSEDCVLSRSSYLYDQGMFQFLTLANRVPRLT